LKIYDHPRIQELGWKMILQVHDELILEGPAESAEEAFKLVKECMECPFKEPLLVALDVSGNIADTWYEAK
jgi:DNA polymerase-1